MFRLLFQIPGCVYNRAPGGRVGAISAKPPLRIALPELNRGFFDGKPNRILLSGRVAQHRMGVVLLSDEPSKSIVDHRSPMKWARPRSMKCTRLTVIPSQGKVGGSSTDVGATNGANLKSSLAEIKRRSCSGRK